MTPDFPDPDRAVKAEPQRQIFEFARTAWRFSRSDGSTIASKVQLQLGGKILFSPYPNETYWTVRNGNLCFLNKRREATTEFTLDGTDASGRRMLQGRFLGGSADLMHVLTEIPLPGKSRIPNPPPRVAVMIRTHAITDKMHDLIAVLSDSACFDLYICADCTRNVVDVDGLHVLRHRVEDATRMGFRDDRPDLLWYCGDYAAYFACTEIPDYDYYFLVEYDVDFVDRSALLLEGIINRLGFAGPDPVDFVGCQTWKGTSDGEWGRTVAGVYPEVHMCLFPFIVLSKRAIEYLISERRAERQSRKPTDPVMFCEAFVPSALNAGGFRRADLNVLIPGSVDGSTFRIAAAGNKGPMLLGWRGNWPQTIRMLHPVYDERHFVDYFIYAARKDKDSSILSTMLRSEPFVVLSEQSKNSIARCMKEIPAADSENSVASG
jgi:hypothetical protein